MSVAFVKNTFLTIATEDQLNQFQGFNTAKTIDLGCLKDYVNDSPMSKASVNTESTGCCSSVSNISVADTEDLDSIVAEQKAHAHACGECKPCAFAMKAGGCQNDDCGFCHEEHDKEFLKFIRKRNRAMRMAQVHGDAPRCAETYAQYTQQKQNKHSCC
jgi:hypothetical protein